MGRAARPEAWVPLVWIACVGVFAAGPGGRQEAPQTQPTPTFRTGVNLVRVDVSVLGPDDRPADDLTAEDFEVEEDGVRQRIETFQVVRLDGQPAPGDDDSLDIRSPEHAESVAARDDVRLFAIFLDDYHVDRLPVVTLPLRQALTRFVQQLGPTDLVAVMDPLTPLSALRFTRSQPELLARVKEFEGRRGQLFPLKSVMEEAQAASGQMIRIRAEVTLSALTALVTRLGGMREGRKSVLFVSQGPELRFRDAELWEQFEDVVEAANRGSVTIHVLDPRYLGAALGGSRDTLQMLASETGGRAIVNTNDPTSGLTKVIAEASAYYLLGYAPSREPADGRFHRISVRTRRSGLRVVARRGYWAPDAGEVARAEAEAHTARPEAPAIRTALAGLAASRTRRALDVWVGFARGGGGRTRMAVAWERPAASGDVPVRLDVEARSEGGAVIAGAPTTGSTASRPEPTSFELDLDPGAWTLRFTATGADGSTLDRWEERVEVADLGAGPLALATPRLSRARNALELRELRGQAEPPPTAVRDFRRTDRVLVAVTCYSEAPGVRLSAALLNQVGQELAALPVPPLSDGRAGFELPLTSLAPGTYVLRVRVEADGRQAERFDAFRVAP